ncbi:BTAD domain-containing putative transcriptional regulator [Kitasatospora phosalacinea]|uniref:AfsR/SARP family transcriptional regulator n=1 Tax=Kitasatospora phosalacinea TaxID=2065 RepID=UPI00364930F9
MRFQILGPLLVSREADGPPLALGPPKQRCLLAALLLEANRVVSLERLAATIWDADAPASWAANVRTYASGLRTVLADPAADGGRLLSRSPGYGLTVAEHELDLAEFRRLAGWGRSALAAGDAYTAVANLDLALDLWRGSAAEDVRRSAAFDRRLAAVDEERLAAVEDWVDARQMLGRHRPLVLELRELTDRHPLRERLWAALMLALYRSGDASGALEAYRQARGRLAGDLGLDPGPALVRLQQAVLARDGALDSPSTRWTDPAG